MEQALSERMARAVMQRLIEAGIPARFEFSRELASAPFGHGSWASLAPSGHLEGLDGLVALLADESVLRARVTALLKHLPQPLTSTKMVNRAMSAVLAGVSDALGSPVSSSFSEFRTQALQRMRPLAAQRIMNKLRLVDTEVPTQLYSVEFMKLPRTDEQVVDVQATFSCLPHWYATDEALSPMRNSGRYLEPVQGRVRHFKGSAAALFVDDAQGVVKRGPTFYMEASTKLGAGMRPPLHRFDGTGLTQPEIVSLEAYTELGPLQLDARAVSGPFLSRFDIARLQFVPAVLAALKRTGIDPKEVFCAHYYGKNPDSAEMRKLRQVHPEAVVLATHADMARDRRDRQAWLERHQRPAPRPMMVG